MLSDLKKELETTLNPLRSDMTKYIIKALRHLQNKRISIKKETVAWIKKIDTDNYDKYSSHLYNTSNFNTLKIKTIKTRYKNNQKLVNKRQILQTYFNATLSRDPSIIAFKKNIKLIKNINQTFAKLQIKYKKLRITNTKIREYTIIGQKIKATMRKLQPITEIQYLNYLIYTLTTLTDDLTTLQYQTKKKQKTPLIIKTKKHRLEEM